MQVLRVGEELSIVVIGNLRMFFYNEPSTDTLLPEISQAPDLTAAELLKIICRALRLQLIIEPDLEQSICLCACIIFEIMLYAN